jgi:hypothetical protein
MFIRIFLGVIKEIAPIKAAYITLCMKYLYTHMNILMEYIFEHIYVYIFEHKKYINEHINVYF